MHISLRLLWVFNMVILAAEELETRRITEGKDYTRDELIEICLQYGKSGTLLRNEADLALDCIESM